MLLWDSANYSDVARDNNEIISVVSSPLKWQIWSETDLPDIPKNTSVYPIEQLKITNDDTVYVWYRRNVTLKRTLAKSIIRVQSRIANALIFFLNGQYLGEFDNHAHTTGTVEPFVAVDLSHFKSNQQYLLEILSLSIGVYSGVGANYFERKGIDGYVWFDGQLIVNDEANLWEHQKGLAGEYFQIYTEQGSSKVDWNTDWTKGIGRPVTWFQARFDLDHLVQQDLNANPILLDALGLNRGHAYINGNDIGLYWLIQGICQSNTCCCQQAQINCLQPTQRYYHIPSDWLMPKNNLITIFDELGAPSPGSVNLVQRVITK
jgi:hypothetical protein